MDVHTISANAAVGSWPSQSARIFPKGKLFERAPQEATCPPRTLQYFLSSVGVRAMNKTVVVGLCALAVSAFACSTSGVTTVPLAQARPYALQSNSPSVSWEFPTGIPQMVPVAGADGRIWGVASSQQSVFIDRLDPKTFRF